MTRISSESIQVNCAFISELAKERRAKHSAMITILQAVVSATLGLFVATRFDLPPTVLAILPWVGIVVALASMFMIRVHRKELRRIEWCGSDIEQLFRDNQVEMATNIFIRPDSKKLPVITIPVMVHTVLVGFWGVMLYIS